MLGDLLMRLMNRPVDDILGRMLTDRYSENLFSLATASQKMSIRAIMEASLRAQSGTVIDRPLGSPNVQSRWEKIFLSPRQLFELPTPEDEYIDTSVTIGPMARKPMKLRIPIMITAMSYGGSLSLHAKVALAKGASLVGTSTNTGESALSNEEREAAGLLVGQYNRGGWMNTPDQLSRLDAIEVQLGQGAYGGGAPWTIYGNTIRDHMRSTWHLERGEDARLKSRMPGVDSPDDVVRLLNSLKDQYDVPIGVKIAGSHFIENDLEVIIRSDVDYIVIDGAEGGTAGAPVTLEDDMGLPTLFALARASRFLEERGVKDKHNLIIAGGLTTPGHFLKALALGADAVYIGSIAIMAMIQDQMIKSAPLEPSTQLVLYDGKHIDQLDIDQAAKRLSNFLTSCTEEMVQATITMGRHAFNELSRDDLVTVDKDLAEALDIAYAGRPGRPNTLRDDGMRAFRGEEASPSDLH